MIPRTLQLPETGEGGENYKERNGGGGRDPKTITETATCVSQKDNIPELWDGGRVVASVRTGLLLCDISFWSFILGPEASQNACSAFWLTSFPTHWQHTPLIAPNAPSKAYPLPTECH